MTCRTFANAAGRRGLILIRACTREAGVHAHENAITMFAPALPYVAGHLCGYATAGGAAMLALSRGPDRPRPLGCVDRH